MRHTAGMRPRMSRVTRGFVLDWMFLVGVALKGLDGLVELLIGVPLLFISHVQLADMAADLGTSLITSDPDSLVAGILLHASTRLAAGSVVVGGIYLVVHGVVKLAIVIALARGSRRVYPWAVGVLALLTVVQVIDLVVAFSIGMLLLTLLDGVIIALIVREWRAARLLPDVAAVRAPWLRHLGVRGTAV